MVSDPSNAPENERSQFSLNKLFITFLIFVFASRVFSVLVGSHLMGIATRGTDVTQNWHLVFPQVGLFTLAEMVIVVLFYRPLSSLLRAAPPGKVREDPLRWSVLMGLGTGLLVLLVTLPVLQGDRIRTVLNALFPSIPHPGLRGVVYCLLFGLALPVGTELVFRGIVLRTLVGYVSPAVAIVVAAVASAALAPVFFNWLIGLALGLASGYLYHRRRSLVGPIVADITVWIVGSSYVLWRIWS